MRPLLASSLFTAIVALLGAGAYSAYRVHRQPAPSASAPAVPSASKPASDPSTLSDPLLPARPMQVDAARGRSAAWVDARPQFQYSRPAAQRGGIEPCATQPLDASGWGTFAALGRGKLLLPDGAVDAAGGFDLLIHLHGEEPVRRELVKSGQRFVLYTLTFDPSESYAPVFNAPGALNAMVSEIEHAISTQSGAAAHVRHLALSAWSAGFVGVEAALAQTQQRRIDAVLLIDGLHAPRRDRAAFEAQLRPFVEYAQRAAAGDGWLFVSHSSIDPPDFASTTECAHYLVAQLGGEPSAVRREDAMGLELIEAFSRGSTYVRGYAGNDKADHCAQLAVLRDALSALGERWRQ